jgi:hypothetical protein
MTNHTPGDQSLIRFAEKVLALLDQGTFTATYKYAVLLGLMDQSMEIHGAVSGHRDRAETESGHA